MNRLFRDAIGGPLCPQGSVACIGALTASTGPSGAGRPRGRACPRAGRAGGRAELRAAAPRVLRRGCQAAAPDAAARVSGLLGWAATASAALRRRTGGDAGRRTSSNACWSGASACARSGSARVPLRQGPRGRPRPAAGRRRRAHGFTADEDRAGALDERRVQHPHPRGAGRRRFRGWLRLLGRRMRSAGTWCAASSSGARWLSHRQPAVWRQDARPARHLPTWVHGGGAPVAFGLQLRHASDRGWRRAAAGSPPVRLSTATSTAAASRSNSSPTCATKRNSPTWPRWSRRSGATTNVPGPSS